MSKDLATTQPDETPNEAPSCALCGPPLPLEGNRVIRIRHLVSSDAAGLKRLYGSLSAGDLTLRFFTGAAPADSFFERWAGVAELGGFGLVAELDDVGEHHLIGDAAYTPLSDGDVELGIAVDPGHRGWLGSTLLSALLAHAHERGVSNVQAIVKTDNLAMRGLASKRPCAVFGHLDWDIVRLTMSTDGSIPGWPPNKVRPRVLVETNRTRWMGEDRLREAGFDVMLCAGSEHPDHHCPVQNGLPCPLVDGADAVLVDLDPTSERTRELIAGERELHPAVPLVEGFRRADDELPHRRDIGLVVDEIQRLTEG